MPKNAPVLSIGAAVLFIIGAVAVVVSGHGDAGGGALIVGLVVSTIPSLIAAAFAERVSRDVRNGTVTEKARQGAHKALAEAGVVTNNGAVTNAALQSLEQLLRHNTIVTQAATASAEQLLHEHEHAGEDHPT